MDSEKCVACGSEIPEGRQVCENCADFVISVREMDKREVLDGLSKLIDMAAAWSPNGAILGLKRNYFIKLIFNAMEQIRKNA